MQKKLKNDITSRHMFKNKTYIFNKRFIFGMCLSFIIMLCDYKISNFVLRQQLQTIVSPLYYIANIPTNITNNLCSWFRSKKTILKENQTLKNEIISLSSKLQKSSYNKQKQSELIDLKHFSENANLDALYASILGVDPTNLRQIAILNKGSNHGVTPGQIVLDAQGLLGQIIDVGPFSSTLLLISDVRSAVPIKDARTGEYAILEGQGRNKPLLLINLPNTAAIKINDLLVTSGLGKIYPEGYKVGHIKKISHLKGEEFMTIYVDPIANLNKNNIVLIILTDPKQEFFLKQIKKRLQILHENF